jgi:hypothetical protein
MVDNYRRHHRRGFRSHNVVANPIGGISFMRSLVIFIAEFQTAKRQLLTNFEASGDGRSSLKGNEDDVGSDSLKADNFSENTPI